MSEALEILKSCDAFLEGHFLLSSGRHSSAYCQMAYLQQYPDRCAEVMKTVADKVKEMDVDVLVGPAMGGIVYAYELARQTGKRAIFTERVDNVMTLKRFAIHPGEKCLIAEDVVTTGISSLETKRVIEENGGICVGITCVVDRTKPEAPSPIPIVASALKLDLPNYAPEECPICKEGKLPLVHLGSRKMKQEAKQTLYCVETRKTMNAYLLLANGMVFAGQSVGAEGVTVGEVVFATGMVGFQETLTDPSYYGQIITQTYPLIGNYGMNSEDVESTKIWARGYIVREACKTPSNFRSEETLDAFLKKNGIIGIEGIDTRHLTRIIRESGVMNGAILTTFDPADPANKAETEALLAQIRAYAVTDAVKNVTCEKPEVFNPQGETHIVLMHYGCKRNIVRCLVKRGCKVTVMPAFATAEEIKALAPDGIMLSNGPGDPAEPVEVIENLKHIFELNIPTFGICLGHQLSALAAGAKTMKLKYGHRGANQPVTDFESGRTFITSQNHGYAVVGDELPAEMGEVAQVNANDGTCEGIKYKKWNCFTVQFHPEANGGPKDTEFLFDRFLNNVKAAKKEAR